MWVLGQEGLLSRRWKRESCATNPLSQCWCQCYTCVLCYAFQCRFSFSTLLYSISVYHPLTEAAMLVLLPNWSSLIQLPPVVVCVQQRILRLMVECLLSSTWQYEGVLQLSDNRGSITLRQLKLISWLYITESPQNSVVLLPSISLVAQGNIRLPRQQLYASSFFQQVWKNAARSITFIIATEVYL